MSKYKKKWRYTIHYVKPTAQLLFKSRFPKGGPTCRRQVVVITCNHIHLIHQCNRLISWYGIQSTIYIVAFTWHFIAFHPFCFILAFICISCYNGINLLFLINRRDCSSHCLLFITSFIISCHRCVECWCYMGYCSNAIFVFYLLVLVGIFYHAIHFVLLSSYCTFMLISYVRQRKRQWMIFILSRLLVSYASLILNQVLSFISYWFNFISSLALHKRCGSDFEINFSNSL